MSSKDWCAVRGLPARATAKALASGAFAFGLALLAVLAQHWRRLHQFDDTIEARVGKRLGDILRSLHAQDIDASGAHHASRDSRLLVGSHFLIGHLKHTEIRLVVFLEQTVSAERVQALQRQGFVEIVLAQAALERIQWRQHVRGLDHRPRPGSGAGGRQRRLLG